MVPGEAIPLLAYYVEVFNGGRVISDALVALYWQRSSPISCRFLILLIQSCSRLVISVTEHLVEVVDKLSTTAVVFIRSERELEYMCLYGA